MAGRSVSPGAALLRSSRMFSMPTPIPAPPGDHSLATKHYSPTATVHYPTHLTVTTTSSSRIHGDWGFKRPLPPRTTTNTTYPLIRVRQVDSTEHVTDFQSASDHTITLKKFQELNLPISVPTSPPSEELVSRKSVFEESTDMTALDDEQKVKLANRRWKFAGPWLAGMTDGDFNRYLEKKVRGKRAEFRAFLRQTLAAKMTADQAQKARENAVAEPPKVTAGDITDSRFTDYIRELRQDRMTLYNLVSQFLDLAPIDLAIELRMLAHIAPGQGKVFELGNPYGANGPPITHPSAGLSYLRTRNFQENHPLYGPQLNHAPVKARVVRPSQIGSGATLPTVGVAGFIGCMPRDDSAFNASRMKRSTYHKILHEIDLTSHGGAKLYVEPTSVTVDSVGKVWIKLKDPKAQAEVVQKELVGESTAFEDELKAMETPEVPLNPRGPSRDSFSMRPGERMPGSASNYGLGRPRSFAPGIPSR